MLIFYPLKIQILRFFSGSTRQLDIGFVLESFEQVDDISTFIRHLSDKYTIDGDNVRVGVVVSNRYPEVTNLKMGEKEWALVPDTVNRALNSKGQLENNRLGALARAKIDLFRESPVKAGARRILFVFVSKPSVTDVEKDVRLLQQQNVKVVFIVNEVEDDKKDALSMLLKGSENIIPINKDGVDTNAINAAQDVLSKGGFK